MDWPEMDCPDTDRPGEGGWFGPDWRPSPSGFFMSDFLNFPNPKKPPETFLFFSDSPKAAGC
jgi:hypothetical protein